MKKNQLLIFRLSPLVASITCILSTISVVGHTGEVVAQQADRNDLTTASTTSSASTVVAPKNTVVDSASEQIAPIISAEDKEKEQLNQALIALRLKQAVEQGNIDPQVLEDYQKHTIEQNSYVPPITLTPSTAQPVDSAFEHPEQISPDVSQSPQQKVGVETEAIPADDKGRFSLSMASPQQIEQSLAEITSQQAMQFHEPVATLSGRNVPIGYDTVLDNASLPVPSNRETLGLQTTNVSDSIENNNVQDGTDVPQGKTDTSTLSAHSKDTASSASQQHEVVTTGQAENTQDTQVNDSEGIDPNDYLPEYHADDTEQAQTTQNTVSEDAGTTSLIRSGENIVKRIYNRVFNDGYGALPRIHADIYLQQNDPADSSQTPTLVKADTDNQPAKNIKAALEEITAQAISDFNAVLPRLREEAVNAAEAVGYYDTRLRFVKRSGDTVDVIIEQLGEPVEVATRVVDIRGEGASLPEFEKIQKNAPPMVGEIFNQGVYKNTKSEIESVSGQHGFFDASWLNKSADIILPDNTADVDLIYSTGDRYQFGEVVFFTLDKETGKLTTDPDKLPVKPELLRQLYVFKQGDKYYQPFITQFRNDLSATRYFNTLNVDVVLPAQASDNDSVLQFDNNSAGSSSTVSDSTGQQDAVEAENNSLSASLGDAESSTIADSTGVDEEITPIEFAVDEETSDKLQAIKRKAERLMLLPDNRVLDETPHEAQGVLGRLSNGISALAKKILPDEEESLNSIDNLPEEQPTLAGRKTPQEVKEDKSIPLYVFVMADKPRDAQMGIGYGTDTGMRIVGRLDNNLINRDGYQAGVSASWSKVNQLVKVYASRPWKHPLNDVLSGNLSYEQKKIDQGKGTFDLATRSIQAGVARNISKESGWNRSYSLRYRLDQLDSGIEGPNRENLPVPFNRSDSSFYQQALLLGYALNKTSTNNLTNPTHGIHQYYSLEAGAKGLLTETNMGIIRAGASGIHSFGESNKHQVLGRFDTGYIWADNFNEVPYNLRFFVGGDRSIRGYDYDSLSAKNSKGYLVGGQVLAVGSAEYNYEFKPGFRAAVFADAGNAYDRDFKTDTKLGVGVGLRWASPVGVVRLDVAAGVLEDNIPVRLHFFIGSPLQ
ncbi:BamA/TamA family outer membrane protein [Psychrobacter sp. I-STPA6b]|uniref:BamA/TamA family outer membrane protein n=1 Tax=Psychrobacter sp. I-STPA6b TaxID=2585718 RepID=UPI001D0C48B0|nr:BamA/TamA family outer membrane protein [Psychrobacter sp. I-STPA6b]